MYVLVPVCFMQMRKTATQHGCVFDNVTVLYIPLWKLSSCICVERNAPFCYASHFIRKCCVLRMYITIALFAVFIGRQLPTVLHRRVHIAAHGEGRGKLCRFPRNPVW